MATTIQISEKLMQQLKIKKMHEKESYEEVIWDLIEDSMELSEETLRRVENAKKEIARGKFYTHEQIKKDLGV